MEAVSAFLRFAEVTFLVIQSISLTAIAVYLWTKGVK